ncbi:MAG: DUF1501 domain-containing protein [Puniceicoccales bacterium]|jgi:hypothetical protein|nr:DUF1501 domain-containing protein [Puniceicoccales bacterium]
MNNTADSDFFSQRPSCGDPLCNAGDHASDAVFRRAFALRSRRDFLRAGALTVGAFAFAPWLRARPAGNAAAKAVIQIFLDGGPSHLDTFDPKPGASADFTGPWRKAIGTNVTGIQINELLPLSAQQADKFSILRGMSHGNNNHETAAYMMQTGSHTGSDLVYPAAGAVVARKLEESGALKGRSLPPYMAVPRTLGRFSEAGFLGAKYRAFVPGSLADPPADAERKRLETRSALLAELDTLGIAEKELFEEDDFFRDQAREMVLGKSRVAFDISREPASIRELYGDSGVGRACLQARRLVENGVAYVTVNMGGWDTHRDQAAQYRRTMPALDRAFSGLLADLAQRGMLATTIVTCGGEFGRTPRFQTAPPWNGGRNHFGAAFSWALAGGGFSGGKLVGETDLTGAKVISRVITPGDLSASIYRQLGIDPKDTLPHPSGPVPIIPASPPDKLTGIPPRLNLLRELV